MVPVAVSNSRFRRLFPVNIAPRRTLIVATTVDAVRLSSHQA